MDSDDDLVSSGTEVWSFCMGHLRVWESVHCLCADFAGFCLFGKRCVPFGSRRPLDDVPSGLTCALHAMPPQMDDEYESDLGSDEGDGDEALAMDSETEEVHEAKVDVLTPTELLSAQFQAIEEVNSIFQIPAATARHLLAHFNWNKERLLERYYSDGDPDRLYAEAHCVKPENIQTNLVTECGICCGDIQPDESVQLPCGHPFCQSCWAAYFREKVMNQGTTDIACMEYTCDVLVDEYTVSKPYPSRNPRAFANVPLDHTIAFDGFLLFQQLVIVLLLKDDQETLARYNYLVAKAFVKHNKKIQWCPAVNCTYALRLELPRAQPVTCKCGTTFCFKCQQEWHAPLKCTMLGRWLKKCADDSETSNWLSSHTKECPKCHATIEKNGGCNHMTCQECRHEFCWQCMGDWAPHGSSWYQCNRFDEQDAKDARARALDSRASLDRYLFYFHRFANHDHSSKLEHKLWQLVEHKQREMQKANFTWIEVQFLGKAVESLQRARSVLKFTYVFAYYLAKNNQCEIFESNQRDLEMATERLSGFLEGEATDIDLSKLRLEVMDLSNYCDRRYDVLLDHVQEGYEKGLWEYNDEDMRTAMATES
ncbi:uncharacterized protein MONBRDRAFT_32739 [Monosiga brevicollis MX1]|uniref:RBR-type E3 ubiquitin transferase n=1 Tax=Monosiga brevicollis TaxID=81824 RepID=A9V1E8_MONBE|nr:uncharacterized protein MONBRDRAFT_32739 [Monosiga brevicollis MX1]EDQ88427.1 predicted protein [Monosiga brevicollis MX1]|eukprot:XP_001746531.1 hypothetical protein [Monosiga brevicollis MX1]